MSTEWKVGDRFRLRSGVEGEITETGSATVRGKVGGVAVVFYNSELDALAECIEPPYVPQVGDIVERRGFFHRIEAVGDGTATTDDGTVLISELTLIARKGEVYR